MRALTKQAPQPLQPRPAIRAAIVDDSTIARAMMGWILEQAGINLVATASNGRDAIGILASAEIDVLILDLQMPHRDGLSALPEILAATSAAVLVVSSLTTEGARSTIEALRLGAADTLAKPHAGMAGSNGRRFGEILVEKVQALGTRHVLRPRGRIAPEAVPSAAIDIAFDRPLRAIGIAASTGGPTAMFEFFAALGPHVRVPIVITQHLPPPFVPIMAEHLSRHAQRRAVVAADGMALEAGTIHIAPGEAHIGLARDGENAVRIRLDRSHATSGCCPSADPMFSALAEHFGDSAIAVVLSGMGRDGAEGARELRRRGGVVVAQDVQSSVVWGMPGAVTKEGIAQASHRPEGIARLINAISSAGS